MQLHVAKKTLHSGQAQFVCIALRPLKGLGLIRVVCRRTPKVMGGCRAKRDMSKFVCFVVARLWVWNGLNLLLCAAGTQSGNGKSSIAQILAEWKRHVFFPAGEVSYVGLNLARMYTTGVYPIWYCTLSQWGIDKTLHDRNAHAKNKNEWQVYMSRAEHGFIFLFPHRIWEFVLLSFWV